MKVNLKTSNDSIHLGLVINLHLYEFIIHIYVYAYVSPLSVNSPVNYPTALQEISVKLSMSFLRHN